MARYIDIDKYKKWDGIPKCKDCRHSYVITEHCLECYYDNGGKENIASIEQAEWKEYCNMMDEIENLKCQLQDAKNLSKNVAKLYEKIGIPKEIFEEVTKGNIKLEKEIREDLRSWDMILLVRLIIPREILEKCGAKIN